MGAEVRATALRPRSAHGFLRLSEGMRVRGAHAGRDDDFLTHAVPLERAELALDLAQPRRGERLECNRRARGTSARRPRRLATEPTAPSNSPENDQLLSSAFLAAPRGPGPPSLPAAHPSPVTKLQYRKPGVDAAGECFPNWTRGPRAAILLEGHQGHCARNRCPKEGSEHRVPPLPPR